MVPFKKTVQRGNVPESRTANGRSEVFEAAGNDHSTRRLAASLSLTRSTFLPASFQGTSIGVFSDYSVENKVMIPDFHATVLHLLGLDHERLTFRHAGRDFRLTDVHGRVVCEIIS